MAIGPLNPLTFIGGSTPVVKARAAADPAPLKDTPAQKTAGVILSLRSGADGAPPVGTAPDLVYSRARKPPASQQGEVSGETSDANGVLLAEPASPEERKAQEFVHQAVHTMRAYADEQDRLKNLAKAGGEGAQAVALIPRSLADVQKLVARFKVFA